MTLVCVLHTDRVWPGIRSATTFVLAYRLLERQKLDNGNAWPETIAVVLWGTDNIKTYGESLAQVLTRSHSFGFVQLLCVAAYINRQGCRPVRCHLNVHAG